MTRFPSTENTEILNIRISKKLKAKLQKLADKKKFGCSNSSEIIRYLIEYHSRT